MPTAKIAKNGKKARALKEQPAAYETEGQYLPVRDRNSALDAIFKDPDAKHGQTLFAAHELNTLDL